MKISGFVQLFIILNLLVACCAANAIELTLGVVERSSSLTRVAISNNSEETYVVPLKFIVEDHYIRFEIFDSKGNKVRFIGQEIKFLPTHADYVTMNPKSSFQQIIDLAKYYELKRDIYTVKAIYHVLEGSRNESNLWYGKIESNYVTLDMR